MASIKWMLVIIHPYVVRPYWEASYCRYVALEQLSTAMRYEVNLIKWMWMYVLFRREYKKYILYMATSTATKNVAI